MAKRGAIFYDEESTLAGKTYHRFFYNYKENKITEAEIEILDANDHWCRYVEVGNEDGRRHVVSIDSIETGKLSFSGTGVTSYSKRGGGEERSMFEKALLYHYVSRVNDAEEALSGARSRLAAVEELLDGDPR